MKRMITININFRGVGNYPPNGLAQLAAHMDNLDLLFAITDPQF